MREVSAHTVDRQSGGYVSETILKAEFEADYLMSYQFRIGHSDLVYSNDSDISALCGTECLSICFFW